MSATAYVAEDELRRVERLGRPAWTGPPGARIAWRRFGPARTTPVVLLHGGSGSWLHWIRNVETLARDHDVLAPDTPGLGDSDPPLGGFDPEDLLGSVRRLARALALGLDALVGERPVHLVGFSMGGVVGGHLAAMAPERVRAFTLVGGAALGVGWSGLPGRLRATTPGMPLAKRLDAQRHNLGVLMLRDPEAASPLGEWIQLRNLERARIRTHALGASDVLARALPSVRAPIDAIWGEHDVYLQPDPSASARALRTAHPEATVHHVSEAGHWVMFERAARFDALLAAILERRGTTRGDSAVEERGPEQA